MLTSLLIAAVLVAVFIGTLLIRGALRYLRYMNVRALPAPPDKLSDDLRQLKHRLSKLRFEAGVEAAAERATGQFQAAQDLSQLFLKTLGEKLQPGELTYERYRTAGTDVQNLVVANLRRVADALESQVASQAATSGKQAEAAEASPLLADNDKALAELNHVNASIRAITTTREQPSADLNSLLSDLEDLASRAKSYSTR